MSRFVRQSDVEKIAAPWWEIWEYCKIGRYSIEQRDAVNAALVEIIGLYGEIPQARLREATVPVLLGGLRDWTFRDLGEGELRERYEAQAEELGKDMATLTDEDKCDAVKDIPIVPLDEEWMRQLEVDDAVFIARAIREKNRGRTAEEQQDFLRPVGNGDRDEE